jgi:hypothetical protein
MTTTPLVTVALLAASAGRIRRWQEDGPINTSFEDSARDGAAMSHYQQGWATVRPATPTLLHRLGHGAAEINGVLYIVGGMNNIGVILGNIEAYDPATHKLDNSLPPIPTPRFDLAVVAVGNVLYVFGGADVAFDAVGSLEAFDTVTETWTSALPPMPTPRARLAAAAIGSVVYTVGGSTDFKKFVNLGVVEAFDTASQTWQRALPALPTPRYGLAAVAVGTVLYAVGGSSTHADVVGLGTVDAFDTVTRTWNSTMPPMPTPRWLVATVALGNVVFAVGGEANGTATPNVTSPLRLLDTVEAFDTVTLTWRAAPAMPSPSARLGAAAAIGKVLFVAGGADHHRVFVNAIFAFNTSCAARWEGTACANCDARHFGVNCSTAVSCVHGTASSGTTGDGQCTSCDSNWSGQDCDDCDPQHFGPECTAAVLCARGIANSGVAGNGRCVGPCDPNWTGAECDRCDGQHFGSNCSGACSCHSNGTQACSHGLAGNGNCGCKLGWTGRLCGQCGSSAVVLVPGESCTAPPTPARTENVVPVFIAVAVATVAFILFVCCAGAVRWRRSGQGRAKWHTLPRYELRAPVDHDYCLLPAAISWVYETAQASGSATRGQNRVKLGNGHFGIVHAASVASDTTPTTPTLEEELRPGAGRTIDVAIKSPLLDKEQMKSPLRVKEVLADFEREMRINVIIAQKASKGSHPFIAKLFGCVSGARPMLVLERCHGNLKEALARERPGGVDATRPADPSLRGLQVAIALAFLEKIDIVHRDVAARNVLLGPSAGNVLICKLADFGCARELGVQKQCFEREAYLASAWMPPETLLDHVFTPASDRWSFGILLWEIYTQGSQPYSEVEPKNLADHIAIPSNRPEREATKIPQEAYNLMEKCWAAEPSRRPSSAELISALKALSGSPVIVRPTLPCSDGHVAFGVPLK